MTDRQPSLAYKTKQIIKKYEFDFKKNFGQNFLVDERVLDKIVASADITENDVVLEVGPGIGTLTQALAKKAKKVIAVEIDKTLIPILGELLADFDNIEIINEDILKVDINEIVAKNGGKPIKVVANLPYYITTPIIMNILEKRLPVESITVMIQKEVAYRMQAQPKSKEYGALSLIVQYYCTPYLVANVPQNCFMPRPNVDSAVIRLTTLEKPAVDAENTELLFHIIKTAFAQRRKTLLNCFFNCGGWDMSKEELTELINAAGYDEKVRGEALTLEDYAKITEVFENRQK
ncbi:MAG: 16S rRNA (adenine(1518)-N(6)/adenine(1519)-N(6))-dimethyltransferase RsmA [Firmicutes bacterium]|nr:16S rRNA (adenine(1518)-N(6)/adenine(1519)-N(6))-dimethyltransferase RsmA [Bacillota bacterium]